MELKPLLKPFLKPINPSPTKPIQQPRYDFPFLKTIYNEIEDFYSHWDLTRKPLPAIGDLGDISDLVSSDYKKRLECTRKVVAYSQGLNISPSFSTLEDRISAQRLLIKKNNAHLLQLDALPKSYTSLKVLINMLSVIEVGSVKDGVLLEISLHLTIIYMQMVVCGYDSQSVLTGLVPYPPSFLFGILETLNDSNMKEFPVRKLVLVLGKCIEIIKGPFYFSSIGSPSEHEALKEKAIPQLLENREKNIGSLPLKASLQEYSNHRAMMMVRYPSYYIPEPELKDFELPYASDDINRFGNIYNDRLLAQYYELGASSDSITGSFDYSKCAIFNPPNLSSSDLPKSLSEQEALFKKYLYESHTYPQKMKANNDKVKESFYGFLKDLNVSQPKPKEDLRMEDETYDRLEQLYTHLEEGLLANISMLLRLLFYLNVSPNFEKFDIDYTLTSLDDLESSSRDEEIMKRDSMRHKEIITNVISGIILNLLKAAKKYRKFIEIIIDVYAFENICLTLVDNNSPILILKMLSSWFANPNSSKKSTSKVEDVLIGQEWLQHRPLISQLNFFHVCNFRSMDAEQSVNEHYSRSFYDDDDVDESLIPASHLNFTTTINLLNILQKLTKDKTNRILSMVQWKVNAVLKRILKVPNEQLHYYALKLMKSQVPYLGKKWRINNMQVISAIYMNLKHRLKEDYLSSDFDQDQNEAQKKDALLREFVKKYRISRITFKKILGGKTVRTNPSESLVDIRDDVEEINDPKSDQKFNYFENFNISYSEVDSNVSVDDLSSSEATFGGEEE